MSSLFSSPPSPKAPPPGPSPASIAKTVLPGAKADAAARAGGGISPEFLAGLVGQQSGTPGSGQSILEEIRKSLGEQG